MHLMLRQPLLRRAAAIAPVRAHAEPAANEATKFPVHIAAVLAVVTAGLLSACSGGSDAGNTEQFCAEIQANAEQLTQPNLQFSDDIEPLLDLYRDIGSSAPLAIELEWDQLTLAYETASTIVPGDTESEQVALTAIYSTEESAAAVDVWLETNCGVDIGPVFTIVAQND